MQRPGIPSQRRKERRGTLHQIPRHRNRHRSNEGPPAARQAPESNGTGQLHTRPALSNTQKLGNDCVLLVICLQSGASQPPLPSSTLRCPDCDIPTSPLSSLVGDQEGPVLVADIPPTMERNPTPTPPTANLMAMDRRIWTERDRWLFSQTRRNPV